MVEDLLDDDTNKHKIPTQMDIQYYRIYVRHSPSPLWRLCYPPWILKWCGLECSGQRLISLNSKTKRITEDLLDDGTNKHTNTHERTFIIRHKDHKYIGPPSLLVEGLLSTEPTPSSFYLLVEMKLPLDLYPAHIWWELDQLFIDRHHHKDLKLTKFSLGPI